MKYLLYMLLCIPAFTACKHYTPKPEGYFRIETGTHTYQTFEGNNESPIRFNYSKEADIQSLRTGDADKWFNIVYPTFQANIYCSYLPIHPGEFIPAAEDSRNFVYRHTVKADDILQQYYENPEKNVYGILYDIMGNVASPIQFTLTDSTSYFFRGALYFDCIPNQDSTAPVRAFIREDILELIHSFEKLSGKSHSK